MESKQGSNPGEDLAQSKAATPVRILPAGWFRKALREAQLK
jgi:hypothetical protein